jgi:phage terminase large subunit GpA-like protein
MKFTDGTPMVSTKRRDLYARAALLSRPIPKTTPDQWAIGNRRYKASSGMPGARDPSVTPYVIPWCRAIADGGGRYRRAVLITSAQSGKTDGMLDIIGSRLDTRPVPIIYVGPSLDFVQNQFEPRLMELFDQAPSLCGKIARGQKNKKTRKTVSGVQLRLAHAGSSTALKSSSAGLALVDELDQLLVDVGRQGDPLSLVTARGDTFSDFMVGVASTPSIGVGDVERDPISGLEFWKQAPPEDLQSPIWRLFQTGTRHHWAWPCPHCLEYFIPRFAHLKWESDEGEHKTTPAQAKRSAYVQCPGCGAALSDQDKRLMNTRGVFVAPGQSIAVDGEVIGEPPDSSTLSFWVSGLASPFVSFGQRAETYLDAVREASAEKIQVAINAGFGELFTIGSGDAPAWSEVAECRADYACGEVPSGARILVCTVDVQKNRIYYCVRGWGARAESWLIDFGVLFGETIEAPVWTDLASLIQTPICGRQIKLVLIDSGYRPGRVDELPINRIHEFGRQFPRLVYLTKGSSTAMRVPLVRSDIETTIKGTAAKYGLKQLRLDTDFFKSWTFERIRWAHDQAGAWHLPRNTSEDYMRQVVSEARIRHASGRVKWVRRGRENHYLDCEMQQAAAAHFLSVARIPVETQRPQPVKAPQPDDDVEGGELPAEAGPPVRREIDPIDPDRLHSAFVEATRPQGGWIYGGVRPRGSWFNRG